ncbi:Kynurenine formamidase [Boothiomyces macroporosus]|uniref:Kynurenine formamidase n=1 Tax=Boothiomyces macroporosus TaxID=261099 RepID=A0AAD5Y8S4_9FUNG|nr:Kynurenine formamidase [Boothiomyces macroporosus]
MKIIENIPYGGIIHPNRCLDLYIPDKLNESISIAFLVHGGAWCTGDRKDLGPLATELANRGVVTATAGYRLTTKDGKSEIVAPMHTQDVADGLTMLHDRIKEYIHFQPSGVVLHGHSAGAHITGLISLQSGWVSDTVASWIKRNVSSEGIFCIEQLLKEYPSYGDWFLFHAFPDRSTWDRYSLYKKPFRKIPQTIVHSEQDSLLRYALSDEYFKHVSEIPGSDSHLLHGYDHDEVLQAKEFYDLLSGYFVLIQ